MNKRERNAAVDLLVEARLQPRTVAPLSDSWPSIRLRDAYPIQSACVARWVGQGRRLAGYKILLSRSDLMKRFRITEPAFGQLLDDVIKPNGSTIPIASVVKGQAEPEVGVVLSKDIVPGHHHPCDLIDAIDFVTAAIEVPNGHMAWQSKASNVIADNGGAGYAILGNGRAKVVQPSLSGLPVRMIKNDREAAVGTTDAVLGDPLKALSWIAAKLASTNLPLRAGDVVITGSCIPSIEVQPGDRVDVEISGLGTASVNFS